MEKKRIIIIGAGISGMSAGCYGQMNGYDTKIYEMNKIPGGLCTGWKREDYFFDGCFEWMIGINPESIFHNQWLEVGALQNKEIFVHREFTRCEFSEGKTIIIFSDADKLRSHLLEIAPEDSRSIIEITTAIKKLAGLFINTTTKTPKSKLIEKIRIVIKVLPVLKYFIKYSKISIREYTSKKIKNKDLKEVFNQIFLPDYSMVVLLLNLAWYNNKDAGLPIGGSLGVVNSIATRYNNLGGKINYGSAIKNIQIKDGKAIGIELVDGRTVNGDIIISAVDGHHTLFNLLKGQYLTKTIMKCYSGNHPTFTSVQVSLGVNADLSNEAQWIHVKLEKPIIIAGQEQKFISFYNYCHDKTMAPMGKSVIASHTNTSFEYWEKFERNSPEYREEKSKIAAEVIKNAEKRFPIIKDKIEVIDVATPLTYQRYTNVWRGAYMTWIITPDSNILRKIPYQLPGLENFYMTGQWVSSPGTPGALKTGRNVIRNICKRDGKIFQTSKG
jgi:phytoene dehydrogenase-like protein